MSKVMCKHFKIREDCETCFFDRRQRIIQHLSCEPKRSLVMTDVVKKSEATMRCTDCYKEFSEEEVGTSPGCPSCGTSSLPMWIKHDVEVKINWHELRILGMWAANYAESLEDASRVSLHKILKRLSKYRPEDAGALTLVEEVKELQKSFPSASLSIGGEVIVPPVEKDE